MYCMSCQKHKISVSSIYYRQLEPIIGHHMCEVDVNPEF